jgi:hypothetical protein
VIVLSATAQEEGLIADIKASTLLLAVETSRVESWVMVVRILSVCKVFDGGYSAQ